MKNKNQGRRNGFQIGAIEHSKVFLGITVSRQETCLKSRRSGMTGAVVF